MKRLLFVSLSLPMVACYGGERRNTGECPAGETCSPSVDGLDFVGNRLAGELLLSGPRPTAVGGTQQIALEYDRGDGIDVALDLPFTADDNGGQGVRVQSTSGSQVIVMGAGSFSNYLRILDEDGLLMDRKELTGAALNKIELVPFDFESVPVGRELAFAVGPTKVGIALYGDVQSSTGPRSQRLIDTSMQLSLAGAERTAWDTLELTATEGTTPLLVTAGDKPAAQIDIVGVNHADLVQPVQGAPTSVMPNASTSVCFEALSGTRYIVGLTWAFTVDGVSTTKGEGELQRNCISVNTTKTTGTVAIVAGAGGMTAYMNLTVGAARTTNESTQPKPASHAITTAGDRASL